MRSGVLAVLLIFGVAALGMAADVIVPGFTVDTYASGIPDPSDLAIDIDTGTLFYGMMGDTFGELYRVAPDRTAVPVNLSFGSDVGDWYPYLATELEYVDGYLYSLLVGGTLARVDATTGAAVPVHSYSGIGCESGIALRDDTLYMVPGHGWAVSLLSYDLLSGVGGTAVGGLPHSTYGLEYDAVNDRLFFSDSSIGLYEVDLVGGTYTFSGAFTAPNIYRHFAIDPAGNFAYSMGGNQVERINLTDGTCETFITGLPDTAYRDLAFGPSSDGSGWSLYLLQFNSILEVKGFAAPNGGYVDPADVLLAMMCRELGITIDEALAILRAYGAARVRLTLMFSASYGGFVGALDGYTLSVPVPTDTAGQGGAVEGEVVASQCVVGEPLLCSFQITNSFTRQYVEDAVCSLTLVFEGGESPVIVAFCVAPYDEAPGFYAASIDTTGLEAGPYTLYLGCGDLQEHRYTVNMTNP